MSTIHAFTIQFVHVTGKNIQVQNTGFCEKNTHDTCAQIRHGRRNTAANTRNASIKRVVYNVDLRVKYK